MELYKFFMKERLRYPLKTANDFFHFTGFSKGLFGKKKINYNYVENQNEAYIIINITTKTQDKFDLSQDSFYFKKKPYEAKIEIEETNSIKTINIVGEDLDGALAGVDKFSKEKEINPKKTSKEDRVEISDFARVKNDKSDEVKGLKSRLKAICPFSSTAIFPSTFN